jgi:hypothetical protein
MLFRKTGKAFHETDVAAGDSGPLSPATVPRFSLLPLHRAMREHVAEVWGEGLAPQQTIVRASANLHREGAA